LSQGQIFGQAGCVDKLDIQDNSHASCNNILKINKIKICS